MKHTHFDPQHLAIELEDVAENDRLDLYHQVERCAECRPALDELDSWLRALDHFRPLVAPELLTRDEFFEELLGSNPSHLGRLGEIMSDDLYHHWGLCTRLLQESSATREVCSGWSAQLAALACEVAESLDPEYYSLRWVNDLRAIAEAEWGDALRRLGRLDDDAQSFELAGECLGLGTRRPKVACHVLKLEGLFLRVRGRHEEAVARFEGILLSPTDEEAADASARILYWLLGPEAKIPGDTVAARIAQ